MVCLVLFLMIKNWNHFTVDSPLVFMVSRQVKRKYIPGRVISLTYHFDLLTFRNKSKIIKLMTIIMGSRSCNFSGSCTCVGIKPVRTSLFLNNQHYSHWTALQYNSSKSHKHTLTVHSPVLDWQRCTSCVCVCVCVTLHICESQRDFLCVRDNLCVCVRQRAYPSLQRVTSCVDRRCWFSILFPSFFSSLSV